MAATTKIIELENIVIEKGFNARYLFNEDKLEETKNSILKKGLMYPITVKKITLNQDNLKEFEKFENGNKCDLDESWLEKDETYVIIDGERRFRCHIMIKEEGHAIKGIKAFIEKCTTKKDDNLLMSFLKNTGEPFTPVEEANLFNRLINVYSWTEQEVADSTGKRIGIIRSRLNLLNGSKELQEALDNKDISLATAQEIIKTSQGDVKKQDEQIRGIRAAGKDIIAEKKKAEKKEKQKKEFEQKLRSEIEDEILTELIEQESENKEPVDSDQEPENESTEEITVNEIKKVDDDSIQLNRKHLLQDIQDFVNNIETSVEEDNKYKAIYYYSKLSFICNVVNLDIYEYLAEDTIDELEDLIV